MVDIMVSLLKNPKYRGKLEILFDRFCIRREGTSTTRESWHRDVCTDKLPDDIIIGGCRNTSNQSNSKMTNQKISGNFVLKIQMR